MGMLVGDNETQKNPQLLQLSSVENLFGTSCPTVAEEDHCGCTSCLARTRNFSFLFRPLT